MRRSLDTYSTIKNVALMLLRAEEVVTAEKITEKIEQAAKMYPNESIDSELLFRDISALTSVWQDDPSVLRDRKHKPWLPQQQTSIDWNFWGRYRKYLEEEKGWSEKITDKLDSITNSVLGDIGNPGEVESWDRRGMVVGDVQSGKTANYTGLICKAVDAGYKLIIVLAGMTNDLRSQTQSRLDLEFLGYDSEIGGERGKGGPIGVGKYTELGRFTAQALTDKSTGGDFKKEKATNFQLGGEPLLLVVKKNKSPLERILSWVEGQGKTNPHTGNKIIENIPVLILDDEADNASVNTKKSEEDPTTINRAIRRILHTFTQSSYVGYTATPFANIFIAPNDEEIDPQLGEDLFPRNFIYYIKPPSHYTGALQIFGLPDGSDELSENQGLPLISQVIDVEEIFPMRHKRDLVVNELPESLIKAIKVFIVSNACRMARSQRSTHKSMLVHVTRYNDVQRQVMDLIVEELAFMRRMLETRTGPQWQEFMDSIKELWDTDFSPTTEVILERVDDPRITVLEWDLVEPELLEAVSRIDVRGINGDAGGVLDYENNPEGLNVIAIGGDKLSRGLTLEGLSVSYYFRPARNYDTLLQMGRWFGYRPGYLDLCRLFTTEELTGWYQHISVANEELKREFRLMELSRLTPEEYGLKVRTHPDGLNITAANKIRTGMNMRVSFSGHLAQTTVFAKNRNIQSENYHHTNDWIISLGAPDSSDKNLIWNDRNPEDIHNFLRGFTTHPLSRQADTELIGQYISKLNDRDELISWTVVLVSSGLAGADRTELGGHSNIGLIQRTDKTPSGDSYILGNSNIINPPDQYIDLEKDQIEEALRLTKEAWASGRSRAKKEPTTPSGPFIRQVRARERGLLLVYPLDHFNHNPDQNKAIIEGHEQSIIGFAVSFPKGVRDETIEYKVNTKYWQDRYGEDEEEY